MSVAFGDLAEGVARFDAVVAVGYGTGGRAAAGTGGEVNATPNAVRRRSAVLKDRVRFVFIGN